MDTGTVWCAASVRPGSTTSVVAFGWVVAAGWSPIVTSLASRCAPAAASRGPLGHSRNTSRSVAMSGVKRTATSPWAVLAARSRATVRTYCGRSGSGAGRAGTGGHERAPGGAPVPGAAGGDAVDEPLAVEAGVGVVEVDAGGLVAAVVDVVRAR